MDAKYGKDKMGNRRKRIIKVMSFFRKMSCCGEREEIRGDRPLIKIAIVGNPNVGKSVIFNALTGKYVSVSNYPGTTVEVFRGKGVFEGKEFEIIDTPGMYSLLPITEEERVARSILLEEDPRLVIHVVDAKNLERMLLLTFQLLEAGFPLVLVLNFMDEAEELGIDIDVEKLSNELNIPVIPTIAVEGKNIDLLKRNILSPPPPSTGFRKIIYDQEIEDSIRRLESLLQANYRVSKRSVALLLLLEDEELTHVVSTREADRAEEINKVVVETKNQFSDPLSYRISVERRKLAQKITDTVVRTKRKKKRTLREKLSYLTLNPWVGFPIFFIILFLLYEFVGVFGAQISVDFLEEVVFGKYINPFFDRVFSRIIPWKIIQDLFVHEYGIITLGVRYAVAIILPIVATFFFAFSIIEDTGYLPRLAMLIDKVFKKIGLNGRAVIPLVLGFGCDTMATLVTRTLETKRERVISNLLLALAIPCSAQLGVILALLAGNIRAMWVWVGVVSAIFLLVGFLASRIIPGESPSFYMEIPPLRFPRLSNVLAKTLSRVEWYFKEVLPLFILASVFIWLGKISGIFDWVVRALEYPVRWIGLPPDTAVAFLFGFFRRDYGAAGLYDLKRAGVLSGNPLLVSAVTLTLFVPCIAQFSMTARERGLRTALGMALFIFPFAFLVGGLVNLLLSILGVNL